MQWLVHYSAGMCGTDQNQKVEADSADEAIKLMEDEAWEHFWGHNDEEDFADLEPELDIYAVPYEPNKHDMYLC